MDENSQPVECFLKSDDDWVYGAQGSRAEPCCIEENCLNGHNLVLRMADFEKKKRFPAPHVPMSLMLPPQQHACPTKDAEDAGKKQPQENQSRKNMLSEVSVNSVDGFRTKRRASPGVDLGLDSPAHGMSLTKRRKTIEETEDYHPWQQSKARINHVSSGPESLSPKIISTSSPSDYYSDVTNNIQHYQQGAMALQHPCHLNCLCYKREERPFLKTDLNARHSSVTCLAMRTAKVKPVTAATILKSALSPALSHALNPAPNPAPINICVQVTSAMILRVLSQCVKTQLSAQIHMILLLCTETYPI
ncbi:uncharacterized protein KY384_009190 [Bacidia gigantensis]|uniref:uncharacterized protein n=1 Tax=Bacidia gigantensis TaxID=2732470 RepID=UPI001D045002|nr:uncharacterized protein KY384_009190 [Bacidia gigantensis]KAG8525546.1 hypothetical protein KY384_009190 [Bacidia gigantensis]